MNGMNPMQMIQMLRGKDPNAMMSMLMQRNPQMGQVLNTMQNQAKSNGMNAEQFGKQLAKQRGMSEQDLMSMVNMIQSK
ncbi:MAG: hypothetical protein NC131_01135 [Roseburia sp.]|nr:hypothetical protein [Roseburia sp.]